MKELCPDQGSSSSLPAPWQWLRDQEPEPGQHCEWVLLAPWGADQGQGTWTVIDGAGKPLRAKGFSSGKDLMCSNSSITAWRAIAEPEPDGPTDEELLDVADLRDACNAQAVAALAALETLADAVDQFGPDGGADGRALAAEVEKARKFLDCAAALHPAHALPIPGDNQQ